MTKTRTVATATAVIVGAAALTSGGFVAARTTSSSASPSALPAPANLEALSIGQTSIELAWGPALPGELYPTSPTSRSLIVNWGSSRDDKHGPVTYTMTKNGKVIASGLTRLYNKVGFTTTVRTFRACVWATNAIGKTGPQMCATFHGQ